jgi:hypothetical protein
MRVKVLEALSAGKAVAAPLALEGLDVQDRNHVMVAEHEAQSPSTVSRTPRL